MTTFAFLYFVFHLLISGGALINFMALDYVSMDGLQYMTKKEPGAIYDYLRTIKAIKNKVEIFLNQ